MDFVAIDFETASGNPNSACQLGIVGVANGAITEEYCWLIRPPRLYFSPRNIAVHGIRPPQVVDAPSMKELWQTLSGMIESRVLIAHNARFDIHVLIESLAAYDIACPELEFTCTRTMARAAWPGRPGYGLKPLGNWLGIQFRHHDALEDARACAQIALAIAERCEGKTLVDVEEKLRIKRGRFRSGCIVGPSGRAQKRTGGRGAWASIGNGGYPAPRTYRAANVDAQAILWAANDAKPLAGKNIVMLGPLRGLSLAATKQLISDLGGRCQDRISGHTDFVVACGTSLESATRLVGTELANRHNTRSSSSCWERGTEDAQSQPVEGIRLLSERQFRALLPGDKVAGW